MRAPAARRWRRPGAALAATLLLASCSSSGRTTAGSPASTPSASTPSAPTTSGPGAPTSAAPAPAAASWTTYQGDAARHGEDTTSPAATGLGRQWTSPTLDGAVYGQPLVAGGRVIVGTEADTVYALDAATGQVAWKRALGTPVPGAALPCGDIDPSGITGTPVIDAGAGVIWVVTFVAPGRHELVGLRLADGTVVSQRAADPAGADPHVEQQRGALALSGGEVYVPFGGLYGDCGAYHGLVVGLPASGAGAMQVWQVPTSREGGVWAPPGPVIDGAGHLWVATGNSASSSTFDLGDAVVRLSPALAEEDAFAPADWAALNASDADLGSTSPTLVGAGLVLQVGKQGIGYLLSAARAGGVGGELHQGRVCGSAFGGTAVHASTVYVACRDGIAAVQVGATTFSVLWRAAATDAGTPVIAGGEVWELGADGTLLGLDPATGALRQRAAVGTSVHFPAVAVVAGRLYAPAGDHVVAFGGI